MGQIPLVPLGEKAQSTLHCIPSLTVSFIKSMNALLEEKIVIYLLFIH